MVFQYMGVCVCVPGTQTHTPTECDILAQKSQNAMLKCHLSQLFKSNILAGHLKLDSIQKKVAQCQTVVFVVVRPFAPKAGRSCLKHKFKDNSHPFQPPSFHNPRAF